MDRANSQEKEATEETRIERATATEDGYLDGPVEAAQAWLASVTTGDQSPQTLRKAWNSMRTTYGDRVVSVPLRQAEVARIYRDMCERVSISTANLRMSAMSSYWQWLVKNGHARVNPWTTSAVKRQRPDDRLTDRILEPEEAQALVDGGRTAQDKLLMRALCVLWLRVDEAANAQWGRVTRHRGAWVLTVRGKLGKTRSVPVPDGLHAALLRYMPPPTDEGPTALLFRQKNRKPYSVRQIERMVETAAKRAGMPFWDGKRWYKRPSPHWLRHFGATQAIQSGMHMNVVQAILGHSSLATTSRYVRASEAAIQAAKMPDLWADNE